MDIKIALHSETVSSYYAQTLCLLLFPRAKFPDVMPEDHNPRVDFFGDFVADEYRAKVIITTESGTFFGEFCAKKAEKLYMDNAAYAVGRAFCEAAEKCGMEKNAWGLLTGVRPAKPLLSAMLEGSYSDEIYERLIKDYLVSHDKARLCKRVAENECAVIKGIKSKLCSIYISVPFCPTRCAYCSFVSYALPNLMALIPEYVNHLCSDIERISDEIKKLGLSVYSIYIGGGTPTTLDCEKLEMLLSTVSRCFDISSLAEFCVEAGRPDTVSREKFEILKKYGVGRISINPQTLHDKTLEAIGRRHSVKEFFDAFLLAKEVGFDTINTDLIIGLPGESSDEFLESVDGILALSPENITVHTFCIKKSADLAQKSDALCGDDILLPQTEAFDKIMASGYEPYYMYRQKNAIKNLENVGFTKKGHDGVYNIIMMEELQSVIGIGAGASTRLVSKDGKTIARELAPKYPFEYKSFDIDKTVGFVKDFYENKYEAEEQK